MEWSLLQSLNVLQKDFDFRVKIIAGSRVYRMIVRRNDGESVDLNMRCLSQNRVWCVRACVCYIILNIRFTIIRAAFFLRRAFRVLLRPPSSLVSWKTDQLYVV